MLRNILTGFLLWLALTGLVLAAGTVQTKLSTTAFMDLGAAPLQVQVTNGSVRYVVSDSLPAATLAGMASMAPIQPITVLAADAGSHVWAIALTTGASIAATPAYAAASSGGTVQTVGTQNWTPVQVSVAATATQVAVARAGRHAITVTNTTTTPVWLGAANTLTTSANSTLLAGVVGASATIDTQAAVWAIVTTGTAMVTEFETY